MSVSAADPSDEALVAQLAAGRQEVLGPLYQRYAALLFSVAAQSLDTSAAEEIVQDVFLEVWRRAARFDAAQGPFRPWLLQLAHWRILNELRRRRRRPLLDSESAGDGLDAVADDSPEPAERVFDEERRATLRAALRALPVTQRQAVDLAFYRGLTHEQVADQLHVPLGTAKSRIRAGLQHLRGHLAPIAAALAVVALLGGWGLEWTRTQETLGQDERALTLVTSSDVVPLRLTAAPGVPDATHANFRGRDGVGLAVLTMSNFAPPPAGQTYRAWVRHGDQWTALGSLTPAADGTARLIAENQDLAQPPDQIEVTLESNPNSTAPVGPVIVAWTSAAPSPRQ